MAEGYGRWLALSEKAKQSSKEAKAASAVFLPAMIESRPKDAGAQRRLARWDADQGEHQSALQHFQPALGKSTGDQQTIADIGSAYFELGQRREADEYWSKIISADGAKSGPKTEALALYLRTLAKYGLAAEARTTLRPLVVKRLNSSDHLEQERE